jgi:hypothetical protein
VNIYVVTPLDNINLTALYQMGPNVSCISTYGKMEQDITTLSNTISNMVAQRLVDDPKATVIFAVVDYQIPNSKFSAQSLYSDVLAKLAGTYRLPTANVVQLEWAARDYNSDLLNQITKINKANAPGDNTLITSQAVDTEHAGTASFSVSVADIGTQPAFGQTLPSGGEEAYMGKANKYSYLFGLDGLNIRAQDMASDACFISDYIDVQSDISHITLSCSYLLSENASVEFFIIDGVNTVPILAEEQDAVQKEKLFMGSLTVFPVSASSQAIVYKDNYATSFALNDIAGKSDALYTVSYVPTSGWQYKPKSDKIKIKAILRTYDKKVDAPVIKNISIKQWGGDALWQAII